MGKPIRVGILLNQQEVRISSAAPVTLYKTSRLLRAVPAGESFRIWLGNGSAMQAEPGWYVQVGAFRKMTSVDNCKEILAGLTDEKPVVQQSSNKRFLLVRFGPYTSLSEAGAIKDLLRMNTFPDAYLVSTEQAIKKKPHLYLITSEYDKYGLSDSILTLKSNTPLKVDGKRYRGIIEIRINGNRFNVINELPMEDYLKGVVPAELSGTLFPALEALKAQAIAARTYVHYNRGQFRSLGFDTCATQSCQVYQGLDAEQELTNQAIEETEGLILTKDGRPINALFTAICGGRTENVEDVFSGGPVPYLKSVPCEGGPGEWEQATFSSIHLPPATASPYYRRIYLGIARMLALDLLPVDFLDRLNQPASPEDISLLLKRTGAHLGIQLIQTPPWPTDLRKLGSKLSAILFHVDDPDELLHAELLVQPLVNHPAKVVDIVAICSAMLEQMEGQSVDLLRFKVVDKGFMQDPPVPLVVLQDSGQGETPLQGGRLRLGDRARLLEVGDTVAALIIIAPESQQDLHDSFVSSYRWYRYWTRSELEKKIHTYARIGTLTDITVDHTTESGRVTSLRVTGSRGTNVIHGLKVRWALGGKEMKFKLFPRRDTEGNLLGVYLKGTAWGHGVGMCQVGAYGMAMKGATFRDILTHYYTGVTIEHIDN